MENIIVKSYVIGMVETNFYYMYREGHKECIVFDPADYGERIYEILSEEGLEIKAIFLTHAHFDHMWGCEALRKASGAPVYISSEERELCQDAYKNCSSIYGRATTLVPDHWMKDDEKVTAAGIEVQMLSTPGHTEGSCCFYVEEGHILICGDTLFEGSVGRTDLPTGSMSALVRSIRTRLYVLPEDTVCYPGHGGVTTISYEKQHNPFA